MRKIFLSVLVMLPATAQAATLSGDNAKTFPITMEETEVWLSHEQRRALGLQVGPDSIAEIHKLDDKSWYLISSGLTAKQEQGTFALKVSDDLTAISNLKDSPHMLMQSGAPGFDKDYAGGGTFGTCPAQYKDATGQPVRFYVYHAENHTSPDGKIHKGPVDGTTGIGIAKWNPIGWSLEKRGQIIGLNMPEGWSRDASGAWKTRQRPPASGQPGVLYSNGNFDLFYNDMSPDKDSGCGERQCFARARVSADALCSALASGGALPEWKKYYNGNFTEAGMGGKFTPLYRSAGVNQGGVGAEPSGSIYYDATLGIYLSASRTGQGVAYRSSSDGFSWSAPNYIVKGCADAAMCKGRVFLYPKFMEVATPEALGKAGQRRLMLTYLTGVGEGGRVWQNAQLRRTYVTLGK